MFRQDKRLKRLYLKYNRLYWDNLLPADAVVGWDDGTENCAEVNVLQHEGGAKVMVIHVNPKEVHSSRDKHLHLLHEMVHLKLYPYLLHGTRFNEEVRRIASRGALDGLV